MKFVLALLIAGCYLPRAHAQDKKILPELYIASTIPDSLKEDAHAVVRYKNEEYFVKGPGKIVEKYHSIVTILNEKGDHNARLILGYDKKFNSISNVEMVVYNAAGQKIKKYSKSDMYDRAADDGMSIITDNRLIAVGHTIAAYPATVEITYQRSMNSYLDLGHWYPQTAEESVQTSICSVTADAASGFRYKNRNTNIKPIKTTFEGADTYTWQVANVKAVKLEDDALDWQVFPKITFVNNAFVYSNLPGDFSTWQNYGKWQQALNTEVCSLTPARAEEIKKMTADIKTHKEKARFLYNYMQQNMRYVSIQLGIGGLKPFPATFVDEKKYGDCKALSNYMYALLKAVNIPSYYAMVRAGTNEEPADATFPSDPFNHVILCIPFKNDTTWLECTSNTAPFGKLGPFTENRNALLITEDGGRLINTPKSTGDDNRFTSEAHIVLNAEGGAKARLKLLNTGEYRDQYIRIAAMKVDEQKEFLIKSLNLKQPSFLDLAPAVDRDGVRELNVELEYEKFSDVSAGNKNFYRPRVFDLWRLTVPVLEKRKTDFYFDHPLQKSCVATIDLPAGFEVETLPTNQSLKFTYGNYEVNYIYNVANNQIVSTAKFNLNSQVIPAAKYNEMQVYMDAVAKAQNKKLVIRKKA